MLQTILYPRFNSLNIAFGMLILIHYCTLLGCNRTPIKPNPATSNSTNVVIDSGSVQADRTTIGHEEIWDTLHHEIFTLAYPKGWTIGDLGGPSIFVLMSPRITDGYMLMESINLTREFLGWGGMPVKAFAKAEEENLRATLPDCKIIENKRIDSEKKHYHRLIFTRSSPEQNRTFEQHYFVKGDYGYVLTYAASTKEFEDCRILGEQIMATFSIKKDLSMVVPDRWKTWHEAKCSFPYPSNWGIKSEDSANRRVLLLMPLEGDEDHFQENLKLEIQQLPAQFKKLAPYVRNEVAKLEKSLPNCMINKQSFDTGPQLERSTIAYTFGKDGSKMNLCTSYRISDHQIYALTFTAEAWRYPGMELIVQRIMDEFEVHKNRK